MADQMLCAWSLRLPRRQFTVPQADALFVLARREMEHLTSVIAQNPDFSGLVLNMLNRREAVDSSQIEGTHTGFDGL